MTPTTATRRHWAAASLLLMGAFACDPAPVQRAGPPNVVVISIDGLRLDRTGFGGGPNPTTPNLDAFVADSAWFPQAFSQSNESLLSHASLFTSRYPLEVSVPDYLRYTVGDEQLLLAEVMGQVGYDTAGFVSEGHVGAGFGLAQGFELFFEGARWGSLQETVPVALTWLQNRGEEQAEAPFFMFLHGYDCHRSYLHGGLLFEPFETDPPRRTHRLLKRFNETERIIDGVYYPDLPLQRTWHSGGMRILDPTAYTREAAAEQDNAVRLKPESLSHIRSHYDSGVLAADTYVGFFMEGLDALGLWQDTVVIVVSDHGEDLQHHGFTNHRAVIHDSTTRVPMIIGGGAIPDEWRGMVRPEVVDAIDLVPTVTDLVGSVAPAGARGRSILPFLNSAPDAPADKVSFQTGVLGQLSARTATHRLIFAAGGLDADDVSTRLRNDPLDGGAFALFHSAEDPLEHSDIIGREAKLASDLRVQLADWYDGLERSSEAQQPTPEQLKLLREGGYW
jgi:arylsulfatase A-like enzyme